MNNAKQTVYSYKPATFEAVGNGSYRYRWDIEESTEPSSEQLSPIWYCYETIVWQSVTEDKLTRAVIDAVWGNGYEQKLINDYYAATIGVLPEEYMEPYLEFLTQRNSLKERVKADFAAWVR